MKLPLVPVCDKVVCFRVSIVQNCSLPCCIGCKNKAAISWIAALLAEAMLSAYIVPPSAPSLVCRIVVMFELIMQASCRPPYGTASQPIVSIGATFACGNTLYSRGIPSPSADISVGIS